MNAQTKPRGILAMRAQGNPADILNQLNASFSQFKQDQSSQVQELRAGLDDVNQTLAALRIGGGGGAPDPNAATATIERKALSSFTRKGDESGFAEVRAAMRIESDPDGGYTVYPAVGDTIQRKLFDVSPIARLARTVTINEGDSYEEPWDPSDIGAEWVGETEDRPALDSSKLKKLSIPVREIYTNQVVTQRLLDDTNFALGEWLEAKISDKFSRAEGAAFVSGDGILKPKGFLSYDTATISDGARDWGTIQHVNTGASGAFGTDPADAIMDLVYSLRAPYRPNARFLMNLATAGVVRKFKDADGRYMWADSIASGMPPTLAGFPVELDEEMPDIGANSLSIAFGDFNQAYLVVQKPGLRLLRDPYTNKPHVVMYAYRRVGGGLANSEAVKLLRFGTA